MIRRRQLPIINIIKDSDPDNPQTLLIPKRKFSESFVSDSSDSSFDSLPDEEVQKIQKITKALDSGVKGNLRCYKQKSLDFNLKHLKLKEKLLMYEKELSIVKQNYTNLLNETTLSTKITKNLLEDTQKETKTTEENYTLSSSGDIADALRKLREDLSALSSKLPAEHSNSDHKHFIKQFYQRARLRKPKSSLCSCSIF